MLARVRALEPQRDYLHAAGRQEDRVVFAVQIGERDVAAAVADADPGARLDRKATRIAHLDREHLRAAPHGCRSGPDYLVNDPNASLVRPMYL